MASIFKKNKVNPFDDIATSNNEGVQEQPSNVVVARRDGFSFRGAVFTITLIVSLCWIFAYCNNIFVSGGMFFAYLFVWMMICRFFENRSLVPLNLIVNILIVAAPCAVFGTYVDSNFFFAMVPVMLGVTVLGSCPADGRQIFERYPISYYLGNIFIALLCAGIPELVLKLVKNRNLTPRVMLASLVMMLIAFSEHKIRGTQTLLSGRSLSGSATLPKTEFETLSNFVSGRLVYGGVSLVAYALSLGSTFIVNGYTNLNVSCVRALVTTIVFAIFIIVQKSSKMPFESFIAILFFARSDSLVAYLVVLATDIVIKGYITVTRRKSIFHQRNIYADGIPVMLMTIGIFVMVAECCI